MSPQQERFEAWIKAKLPSASLNYGDHYLNSLVEMAWQGWNAALASHAPSPIGNCYDEIYMRGFLDGQRGAIKAVKIASEAAAQPTQPTCETDGHIVTHSGKCVFCKAEIEHNDH